MLLTTYRITNHLTKDVLLLCTPIMGVCFKQIFDFIEHRNLTVVLRWMPSHLKPYDVRPPDVSHLDVVGNHFEDIEAGNAADRYRVEVNAAFQFFHWRNLAMKVQRRMVAIVQNLSEREN